MSRWPGAFACECEKALRLHSTMACKALEVLSRIAPKEYRRILNEADEHASRLRRECRCFPEDIHGR